jgi:hypothetical protein
MAEVGAGRRPLHVGSRFAKSHNRARPFPEGGDFCLHQGHLLNLSCPLDLPRLGTETNEPK